MSYRPDFLSVGWRAVPQVPRRASKIAKWLILARSMQEGRINQILGIRNVEKSANVLEDVRIVANELLMVDLLVQGEVIKQLKTFLWQILVVELDSKLVSVMSWEQVFWQIVVFKQSHPYSNHHLDDKAPIGVPKYHIFPFFHLKCTIINFAKI